jgi:hypothetical protein
MLCTYRVAKISHTFSLSKVFNILGQKFTGGKVTPCCAVATKRHLVWKNRRKAAKLAMITNARPFYKLFTLFIQLFPISRSWSTEYIFLLEMKQGSVSAHSAGSYIATLLVMVNVMKGGWAFSPPPSPGWVNFTLMMECTPESSHCYSVYSVSWPIWPEVGSEAKAHQSTDDSHARDGVGAFVPIHSTTVQK